MSHPIPGLEYFCEDCFVDLEDGGHKCQEQ